MKDNEKYVSTIRKNCLYFKNLWKKQKYWCPLEGIWFAFKNWLSPNFNNSFRWQKKTQNKVRLFLADEVLISTKMKDWLLPLVAVDYCLRKRKKMVSTSQKISFNQLKYNLYLKTGFHQFQRRFPLRVKNFEQKKTVSTSRNEGFRWKIVFY